MDGNNRTPRARPHLKFANRVYAASPLNPNKHVGTPLSASSRKRLDRDDGSSSSLNNSSIAAARNIFRASTISNSPAVTPFSPNIPASTMKKVFAPGGTPVSQRVYREATAQATPRGMLAKSTSADLFTMRIPSPPPELTGEALAKEIPPELEQKGTVYADQYLAHLVPEDYDDLQRRQLLCVLDLRRLKYAANEIFAKKDWKLNVMNFAKEFEKSRSLIMLRYGLYEFKNVKPSDEVLKKWRAAHGLPEPEQEEPDQSPSRQQQAARAASTKRKAEDQLTPKDTALSAASPNKNNKRRAFDREEEAPVATPAPNKNKRKVSVSDEPDENQPAKLPKSTSSATKALFERISNNQGPTSTPSAASPSKPAAPASKPPQNPFATATKPMNGTAAPRSVFESLKPGAGLGSSGNIFGYLSDAGSAKNSGAEADAESSTDSEDEEGTETQEVGPSYEPSVAASGGADTPLSQAAGAPFGIKKPNFGSSLAAGPSSTSSSGARETTPSRSLFDRITKGSDGEPVRASSSDGSQKSAAGGDAAPTMQPAGGAKPAASAPINATWNPNSPIKFTSSAAPSGASLFSPAATSGSSLFAPKTASTPTSNIFGAAPKQDKPSAETATPATASAGSADETEKSGESDKENSAKPPAKSPFAGFAPKPSTSSLGSSLFQPKTSVGDQNKDAAAATKPAPSPIQFGSATPKAEGPKPAPTPQTTNLFGAAAAPGGSIMQSSTLFGKSSGFPPAAAAEPAKTTSTSNGAPANPFQASSLFGKSQTESSSGGAPAAPAQSSTLFGKSQPASSIFAPTARATTPPSSSAAPTFTFGAGKPSGLGASTAAAPLFGTPKPSAPAAESLFGGSPMKQDEPSPAKKPFSAGSAASATPLFSFGASQNGTPAPIFGNTAPASTPAPQANGPVTFGAGGGPAFTFNAGSSGSGGTFNNPFASSNSGGNAGGSGAGSSAPSGSIFNFGGAQPASGTTSASGSFTFSAGAPKAPAAAPASNSPFQFGASNGAQPSASATPAATPFAFGAGSTATPATATPAKPLFGGGATSAPSFNFTSASPQPQSTAGSLFAPKPPQPASSIFGNLQPPANGASTTGTNSPFNFGGASSLATTPATGTPEPTTDREGGTNADDDGAEKHAQITLTDGGPGEEDETIAHEVRAKILKFVPPGQGDDSGNDTPKAKSPWTTKGVGPFRLLKHKTTGAVRMLLRAEPRGHIVINRMVLPSEKYKSEEKYVKLTTSNETGTGLETWMVQVKTKEAAQALAAALEANKSANQK